MAHKLVAAIQVGPHRYGLYDGNKGLAWFGPPGEVLEVLHQVHADYDINGRREQAGYTPWDFEARAEYCAETLGGHVILEPKRPRPAPEIPGRVYQKAQEGPQQVPQLRPKTPAERGPVDPDSLVAALFWDRLAPPDPIDQPQVAQPAEKSLALTEVVEGRVHEAFTVALDRAFQLGYLDRDNRIKASNVIGDFLPKLSKELLTRVAGAGAQIEDQDLRTIAKAALEAIEKGGPTSGNWGHRGRPGSRGGSAPGGGHAFFPVQGRGKMGGHAYNDILGMVTLRRRETGSSYAGAQIAEGSEVTQWRAGLAKKAAANSARLNKEQAAKKPAKEPEAQADTGENARKRLETLAQQHEPGIAKLKETADAAYEANQAERKKFREMTHRPAVREIDPETGRKVIRFRDAPKEGVTREEWEAQRQRYEKTQAASNEAHKPLVEARMAFRAAQQNAVAVDNPMSIEHKYRARFKKTPEEQRRQASWDAGRTGFENLVSADLQADPLYVEFKKGGRGRSFQSGKVISLSKGCGSATVIHEIGHRLEEVNPRVRSSATAFLEYRTAGERVKSLRSIRPGAGYRRDEKTRVDKFLSAYMGKAYGFGGTEIVSMGLEYMYNKPLDFARGDPGMFDMIYNLSRGQEWTAPEGG